MTESVAVYGGSDGQFYTDWQYRRNLATGTWRYCVRDCETGRRLVETEIGSLLLLEPTSLEALPDWAEAHRDGAVVRIVDTRRVHSLK